MYKSKVDWKQELPNVKIMGLAGHSMVAIAKHYGVSRQRIKQLIDRNIPDWNEQYGHAVIRKEREEKYFEKWGEKAPTDLYVAQRAKFNRKKANAIRTGYGWSLKFGHIQWPLVCPILGIELNYFAEATVEGSPSFDRINSNIGYIPGNVQIISWRANRIKNNGTAEEHRKIADYLDTLTRSVVSY